MDETHSGGDPPGPAAGGAPFEGFIAGAAQTPLPAQFFVEILPLLEDEAELRVTLYVFYAVGRRRGELRAVRLSELLRERPLLAALAPWGGEAALREALGQAVARGTLCDCPLEGDDRLYVPNHEAGRRLLGRVRSGALAVPGTRPRAAAAPPVRLGAVRVYEQEIGVLTPAVAEALTDAVTRYPEAWVVEALRLAAQRNARSWRYAEGILRRWEAEGRDPADAGAEGGSDAITGTSAARAAPYGRIVRRNWP